MGEALDRLREFPAEARSEAGHELFAVQRGLAPSDWKPMPSIGSGVREIRVRHRTGAFRVIHVANLKGAIHVLHAFRKQTQKTAQRDLNLAMMRWRQLIGS